MISNNNDGHQRDIPWLEYLSVGPAPIADAGHFYKHLINGTPLHMSQIYDKNKRLEKKGLIQIKKYNFQISKLFCILAPLGAAILASHGLDPTSLKTKAPPSHQFHHEYWLAQIVRRVRREEDLKKFKIKSILYDGQMKQEDQYKQKDKCYPDLRIDMECTIGFKNLLIELDGLQLVKWRFIKKLRSLKYDELLLVVTSQPERVHDIYEYISESLERPKQVLLSSFSNFMSGGLTKTSWLTYPGKKSVQLNYEI